MNPASRLASVHQHFSRGDPKRVVMTVWQEYLGIDPKEPTAEDDAYAAMTAALGEIRNIQNRLKRLGAPDPLFSHCADTLRHAFSPAIAKQQLAGYREPLVQPQIGLALAWAAWTLRELNDPEADDQALKDLAAAVEEQETRLRDPAISGPAREMLEHHVRQLRAALRLYRIEGPQALRAAVNEAFGEMTNAGPETVFAAESNPESVGALKKGMELLGKAAKVADNLSKVKKFSEDMYQLGVTYIPPALDWIQNHVPSLPSPS